MPTDCNVEYEVEVEVLRHINNMRAAFHEGERMRAAETITRLQGTVAELAEEGDAQKKTLALERKHYKQVRQAGQDLLSDIDGKERRLEEQSQKRKREEEVEEECEQEARRKRQRFEASMSLGVHGRQVEDDVEG